MKILIMHLPGSGKTTFAERLQPLHNAVWINADKVRNLTQDWDFSENGRIRQYERMRIYADFEKSHGKIMICDFICPTSITRKNFNPDILIWMNTIKEGRFEDTNEMFEPLQYFDFQITIWNDIEHESIAKEILNSNSHSLTTQS